MISLDHKIRSGYRVVGTVSQNQYVWYSPDLDSAKRLAESIARDSNREVEICLYIGSIRPEIPVIWTEATKEKENAG